MKIKINIKYFSYIFFIFLLVLFLSIINFLLEQEKQINLHNQNRFNIIKKIERLTSKERYEQSLEKQYEEDEKQYEKEEEEYKQKFKEHKEKRPHHDTT